MIAYTYWRLVDNIWSIDTYECIVPAFNDYHPSDNVCVVSFIKLKSRHYCKLVDRPNGISASFLV